MPSNFILYCEARTGSYSVVSRLNSSTDVVCHGEVFKKDRIELSAWHSERMAAYGIEQRDAQCIDYVRALRKLNPRRHFGFKLFNHHVGRLPQLRRLVDNPQWKKIVLVRDPLDVYASGLRAERTGIWTYRAGQAVDTVALNAKVSFTPDSWTRFAAHYERFLTRCLELAEQPNTFVIHYSEINTEKSVDAMLAFIGAAGSASETETEYRKQFAGDLSDGFTNWAELQAHIRRSKPFPPLPRSSSAVLSTTG